jgi:hypothetical protein
MLFDWSSWPSYTITKRVYLFLLLAVFLERYHLSLCGSSVGPIRHGVSIGCRMYSFYSFLYAADFQLFGFLQLKLMFRSNKKKSER